jgi:ABC-type lipoprotein release transport system permease subunit
VPATLLLANAIAALPARAAAKTVLVTVPIALMLANLIAFLPGRAAGRVRAATVLRTE